LKVVCVGLDQVVHDGGESGPWGDHVRGTWGRRDNLHKSIEIGCRVTRVVFTPDVIFECVFAGVKVAAQLATELHLKKKDKRGGQSGGPQEGARFTWVKIKKSQQTKTTRVRRIREESLTQNDQD